MLHRATTTPQRIAIYTNWPYTGQEWNTLFSWDPHIWLYFDQPRGYNGLSL